jgi:hypothetical protein
MSLSLFVSAPAVAPLVTIHSLHFSPWTSTFFASSSHGSVAGENNFTLLYLPFLFLLTRFVAYLFYRVGLCSYKYPRLASLKSGQFDPTLLSPCVILSTLDRPTTTRANAPSLVFSSRRPQYALATRRFQSGAARTSTPSRTFPTSECGLGSYFSPSISISELTRRLTTYVPEAPPSIIHPPAPSSLQRLLHLVRILGYRTSALLSTLLSSLNFGNGLELVHYL